MKTYRHLWDEFISAENFNLAVKKAVRSKKKRRSTKRFLRNADEKIEKLRCLLQSGEYKTSPYSQFVVYEPKKRQIYMLPLYPDHIVHHALMNILGPIWQKIFIYDSYACVPGRGLHAASKRCAQFVRRNKYVLKCDIRKYYENINHETLLRIVSRKISDARILELLADLIMSHGCGCGLPIGNLTSQWLGNLYLHDLDMFVKHQLHVQDYIRYCDDFCLFSDDLGLLNVWAKKLREYLRDNLQLEFSKCFTAPTSLGIDFIGYRHFNKFIILTRAGAKRITEKFVRIIAAHDTSAAARSQLASYNGWLGAGCTYNLRQYLYDMAKNKSDPDFFKFVHKYFIKL